MANVVEIVLKGSDKGATTKTKGATKALGKLKTEALGVAKAAGIMGLAFAAGIAVAVRAAIQSADDMTKFAKVAGLAVDDFKRLSFAAKLAGVDMAAFREGVVKLNRSMVEASDNIKSKQARAFAALGISLHDANGALRDNKEILLELSDKFAGYADGATKSALAMELMGKSGARMIPLLNEGSEGIQKLGKLTSGLTDATGKAAEKFNDNLVIMVEQFKNVALMLAERLLPQMNRFGDWLVTVTHDSQKMEKITNGVIKSLSTLVIGVRGIVFWFEQWARIMASVATVVLFNVDKALGLVIDSIAIATGDFATLGNIAKKIFEKDFATAALTAADFVATLNKRLTGNAKATWSAMKDTTVGLVKETVGEVQDEYDKLLKFAAGFEAPAPTDPNAIDPATGATKPQAPQMSLAAEAAAAADLKRQESLANQTADQFAFEEGLVGIFIASRKTESFALQTELAARRGFMNHFEEVSRAAQFSTWSLATSMSQTFTSGLSSSLSAIILQTKDAGQAFKELGLQMVASLVNFFAQWVSNMIARSVLSAAFAAKETGQAVALGAAIASAYSTAATFASVMSFGGAAAAGLTGLAAAVAGGKALAVGGALHGGLDFVPAQESFLLQRGERVIQPEANRDLTEFLAGGGGGGAGGGQERPITVDVNLDGDVLARAIGRLSSDGRLVIDGRSVS